MNDLLRWLVSWLDSCSCILVLVCSRCGLALKHYCGCHSYYVSCPVPLDVDHFVALNEPHVELCLRCILSVPLAPNSLYHDGLHSQCVMHVFIVTCLCSFVVLLTYGCCIFSYSYEFTSPISKKLPPLSLRF